MKDTRPCTGHRSSWRWRCATLALGDCRWHAWHPTTGTQMLSKLNPCQLDQKRITSWPCASNSIDNALQHKRITSCTSNSTDFTSIGTNLSASIFFMLNWFLHISRKKRTCWTHGINITLANDLAQGSRASGGTVLSTLFRKSFLYHQTMCYDVEQTITHSAKSSAMSNGPMAFHEHFCDILCYTWEVNDSCDR